MKPYTPPEPDYRRLSDLQSGIDNWYSPTTLRAEVERVRRETVAVRPTEAAMTALRRFEETCLDSEGYDVSKEVMRQLAMIGLVYHASAGRYGITDFGNYMLATPQPEKDVQNAYTLAAPQPAAQEPPSAVPVVEQLVGALERLKKRDCWTQFIPDPGFESDPWKPAEQYGLDAIAAGQKFIKESGK